MKRWLGVYAVAFFAFLHLPLLTLAVFSFNSSKFTKWELLSRGMGRSSRIRRFWKALGTASSSHCGLRCFRR